MRGEVKSTVGVVADEARRFRRSKAAWLAAVASRRRVVQRAERRIAQATDGLTLSQWNSRCVRRRINTQVDSRAVARALRGEAGVRQAVADADHLRAEADARVRTAREDLASVARVMLRFGPLGRRLAGVGLDELRDLALLSHADARRSPP